MFVYMYCGCLGLEVSIKENMAHQEMLPGLFSIRRGIVM